MKKLILSTIAASLVATPLIATPAAAAPQRQSVTVVKQKPNGRTVVRQREVYRGGYTGNQYRSWRRGERFDQRYARNYRPISNWQAYRGRHLYAPPRGYRWVQSGNDAVLVGIASGLIGAVLAGALN